MEDSVGTKTSSPEFNESPSSSPVTGHSTTCAFQPLEDGGLLITKNVLASHDNARKRKNSSRQDCWNRCTRLSDNGEEWRTCNYCEVTRYKSALHKGTSNSNNHLKKCPEYLKLNSFESSTSKKIDLKVFQGLLADAIMSHGLGFSFVEHESVRKIFKYLNANVETITRNTIKKVCLEKYEDLKGKVKSALKMVPGRISLTCDTWTACIGKGFLCVTAHYIDETWKLHSKLLCFRHLPHPHTRSELSVAMDNVLFDWDIQGKVFSVTAGNATNMDNMAKKLKEGTMLKDLICKGKYFHIRCCAHMLNLIVQKGLKVIDKSIVKLREGINYIAGSEARFMKFYDFAKIFSEDPFYCGGLWLDVATRWNSTYIMLDRALKYRIVLYHYFEAMGSDCSKYQFRDYEWGKIEEICKLLKPFYDMSTLFSRTDYPTANLYLPQVFLIRQRLQALIVDLDTSTELEEAVRLMIEKFKMYWNDYALLLSFAVVFDPRFKFSFVEYSFYGTYGDVKGEEMAKEVKLSLEELFMEYQCRVGKPGIGNLTSTKQSSVKTSFRYDSIEEFQYFGRRGSSKSELDKYLEDGLMDMVEKYDVLDYWKTHSIQYPVLSAMARDILAIPITSVAFESTFSMGERIIGKCRSAVTDKNADALVTMQNWLTGYDEFSLEGSLVAEQLDDQD